MKKLNRNHIKLIALATMLIDHLGFTLYPLLSHTALGRIVYLLLRIIGRISFPLFAYFVAEGFYYTKSRLTYVFNMFLFGIISQLPFYWLTHVPYYFNIMFTFFIACLTMWLFDAWVREKGTMSQIAYVIVIICLIVGMEILKMFNITVDYGAYGILITLMFYIFKNQKQNALICFVALILIKFTKSIVYNINDIFVILQLLSIPILAAFNGNKGKLNLKYLFWWFYPLHMAVLYMISILIYTI